MLWGQLLHFSCVRLCAVLWTVASQAPLSTGFSRKEYWAGLPCPPAWDLPDLGIKRWSLIGRWALHYGSTIVVFV